MLKREYVIFVVLAIVYGLLGSLFFNTIIQAQSEGCQTQESVETMSLPYDAWYDVNMDGIIDLFDLVKLGIRYGTTGDPTHNIPAPAYDSGWMPISRGEELVLTHNLGTTDALVYVIGKSEGGSINQNRIEGDFDGTFQNGLRWHELTNSTIRVLRFSNDWGNYDQVRVRIWKIQPLP